MLATFVVMLVTFTVGGVLGVALSGWTERRRATRLRAFWADVDSARATLRP